ncbi:MAG: DEAD/DEAH box helicase, partial [Deltaproteobacteria bacterium]|nr:DEAD/DEAH box helicase [Deltaproteobacteria bacterium]
MNVAVVSPEVPLPAEAAAPAASAAEAVREPAAPEAGVIPDEGAGKANEEVPEKKKSEGPAAKPKRADRPNFLTTTRFSDFDLPASILDSLDEAGYFCVTPMQGQVIPEALKGKDIAGRANTGTGKIIAFLVPMTAKLLSKAPVKNGLPRALIVTSSEDRAEEIHGEWTALWKNTGLRASLISGNADHREQLKDLHEGGPDIVTGTLGRLSEYIHNDVLNVSAVEVAVMDDASGLVRKGLSDLKLILRKLPPRDDRQTFLFSPTLDRETLELVYEELEHPQYITAEPDPLALKTFKQELYRVTRAGKLSLLLGLLGREEDKKRVIVFCNTKNGVEWVTKKLSANGYLAEGITGDLSQQRRRKLLESFGEGRLDIMVATDVASRGILIDDVTMVFNYDIPQDTEKYVHRIGRVSPGSGAGKAVTFACDEFIHHWEAIENILGEKVPLIVPGEDLFLEDKSAGARR